MNEWRWLLVAVLVALIIGAISARRERNASPAEDVNARMAALAAEAVSRAETEFSTRLDLSADSVSKVEEILGQLHARYAAGQLSLDQVEREAMTWGAYIGEVIRRLKAGRWDRDHPVGGPRSYPIRYDNHESFPCGWCFKRIRNGEEDNVWHKFQVLVIGDGEGGMVFTPKQP